MALLRVHVNAAHRQKDQAMAAPEDDLIGDVLTSKGMRSRPLEWAPGRARLR